MIDNVSPKVYDLSLLALKIILTPFVKTETIGLNNLPATGGAILTPNHISQLDPLLIGVAVKPRRRVQALAKESLFRKPVIGWFFTKMGHIPVHRGTNTAGEALTTAANIMKQTGAIIAIYPEGTIPHPKSLGEFKTGAVRLALLTGEPIIPVTQSGAEKVLPSKVKPKVIVKSLLKALITHPKPVHHIIIGEPWYPNPEQDLKQNTQQLKTIMETMLATQKIGLD